MSQLSIAWNVAASRGDWQLLPMGLATGKPLAAAVVMRP